MRVPSVKEIIFFKSELNALRAEAVLDVMTKSANSKNTYALMFDIDGSRKIREKGILLRLEVIQDLIAFINSHFTSNDHAFWYGNDEIIVIIHENSKEEAFEKADYIRQRISEYYISIHEPVEDAKFEGNVTVTGGLVNVNEGKDVIDIIQLAKARIAKAKDDGRNCIDVTQKIEHEPYSFQLTESELHQLEELSNKKNREKGCLIREAVDTLLLHYPQFHGHRKDRELKMPKDAFTYACTPVLKNNKGE